MIKSLDIIAQQFSGEQTILNVLPLGQGLINDSYQVNTSHSAFVLQRLNSHVFAQPVQIMANLQKLSAHIQAQAIDHVRLRIPHIIQTNSGQNYYQDYDQQIWRALELITPSESRETINHPAEAEQVGLALGHFHRLCSTLAGKSLYDTLPGFHITPEYYRHYQTLTPLITNKSNRADSHYCQQFITDFHPHIQILEHAKQQKQLTERVIHGDPKLNNFLFQPNSNTIISLIDLDTVKPGLVHYDIGDCLRSCCQQPNNTFDLDRAEIILTAYLDETQTFFTETDYAYLYPAIQLIPFELGLRFFSDYLSDNVYFKVTDTEQNLRRAISLFQLVENISKNKIKINKMLNGIRPK